VLVVEADAAVEDATVELVGVSVEVLVLLTTSDNASGTK
jgi:hypothetical protein